MKKALLILACAAIAGGKADFCMWLSPKQFRGIVNNAKDQAPACDDKRDDVDGGNVAAAFHESNYTR